jgi:hypothetical protein
MKTDIPRLILGKVEGLLILSAYWMTNTHRQSILSFSPTLYCKKQYKNYNTITVQFKFLDSPLILLWTNPEDAKHAIIQIQ